MISVDVVVGEYPELVLARHDKYLFSSDYTSERKPFDPWDKDKVLHWASIAAKEAGVSFDDDIQTINWWLGEEAVVRTESGRELLLMSANDKTAFHHYKMNTDTANEYLLTTSGEKVTQTRLGELDPHDSFFSPGGFFFDGEYLDNRQQPGYEEAMAFVRWSYAAGKGHPAGLFHRIWGPVLERIPEGSLLTLVTTYY